MQTQNTPVLDSSFAVVIYAENEETGEVVKLGAMSAATVSWSTPPVSPFYGSGLSDTGEELDDEEEDDDVPEGFEVEPDNSQSEEDDELYGDAETAIGDLILYVALTPAALAEYHKYIYNNDMKISVHVRYHSEEPVHAPLFEHTYIGTYGVTLSQESGHKENKVSLLAQLTVPYSEYEQFVPIESEEEVA